jgi:hypothetical protein
MTYSDDDDYGKHRGYDDFADFADSETLPTDAGLEAIRTEANALVNVAFHESEEDAAAFTAILKQYEMVVMDRKILGNKWLEKLADPSPIPFLTQAEFEYLRELGQEESSVMSLAMKNKDANNYSYGNAGWLF